VAEKWASTGSLGLSFETWKVGWIRMARSSLSPTATGLTTLSITNGQEVSFSKAGNSSGLKPWAHWKGESPVAELVWVLWAYSMHSSCLDQVEGCLDAMQWSTVSISCFILSDWLLDWGWQPEDRLVVAPMRQQNPHQNTEVNWGPRSETTSDWRL